LEAEPQVLEDHKSSIFSMAFSPDGQTLAAGTVDNTVILWSMSPPVAAARSLTGAEAGIRAVAFSPNAEKNTLAAASSLKGKTWVWTEDESGVDLQELPGSEEGVWSVAFSPDGRKALSSSEDRSLRLWDL